MSQVRARREMGGGLAGRAGRGDTPGASESLTWKRGGGINFRHERWRRAANMKREKMRSWRQ